MKKFMLFFVLGVFSSQASALINFQAMAGYGSLKPKEGETYKGYALKAAVVLDPIPLVPLGVGSSISAPFLSNDGQDLTGYNVDVFATAWSPIAFLGFTPFAKIGYIFTGEYVAGKTTTATSSTSGIDFSVGTSWSVIPLVAMLVEAHFSQEDVVFENVTTKSSSFNVLAGLTVGF